MVSRDGQHRAGFLAPEVKVAKSAAGDEVISAACFEVRACQPIRYYVFVILRVYQPEQATAVAAPAVLLPVSKETVGSLPW